MKKAPLAETSEAFVILFIQLDHHHGGFRVPKKRWWWWWTAYMSFSCGL